MESRRLKKDFEWIVPTLTLVDDAYNPLPQMIETHLNWLKSYQADGILVLGTTGEFPNFSVQQRKTYLEAVLSVNPGLPVTVNIGACALADILELQAHALAQSGVDSLMWMPPFYFPGATVNGLTDMLGTILEQQHVKKPFYLYHNPNHSQVDISPELISAFPDITGWKDTSGDMNRIETLRNQFPTMKLHVGTDTEIIQSRMLGCDGVIPGMSNAFPQLYRAILDGETQKEPILGALRSILNRYGKITGLKAYLNRLPEFQNQHTATTFPFKALSPQTEETLYAEITATL
jgi:4-hydroxy-tetrahydrodipicolinate synthase